MWYYILRRVSLGILVLFLAATAAFSLVRMLPGDTILLQLDEFSTITPEARERARAELGLDRPFLEQYGVWMWGVLRGDLGNSLQSGQPVTHELGKRFIVTAHLAVLSLIIALVIALPVGIISAIRQDTIADYFGRVVANLGLALPDFWLAVVIITYMAILLNWIPPIGFRPLWEDPLRLFLQLTIPAAIIGTRLAAVTMRMTRSALLEVMREDYIRTAWAKGLRERAIIVRHALKNAFIPVITVIGQLFSLLLGGTVIVEFVFVIPGVGSLFLNAVQVRDYTVVQGAILFFAAIMVAMNLLVDLTYAWFDPRIRYE